MNGSDRTTSENDIPVVVVISLSKQTLNSESIDKAEGSYAEIISTLGEDPPTLLEFLEVQRINAFRNQVRQ